ncbi:MAG TPA: hypothetical protein VHU89_02945 [Acidobacteriaceae bacterium]|nr:hypothetical protein [Acidobacteriaceae bacterium]
MKLISRILRRLSNNDSSTDLIEYMLIASVLTLSAVATIGALTCRISMEFSSIASHI